MFSSLRSNFTCLIIVCISLICPVYLSAAAVTESPINTPTVTPTLSAPPTDTIPPTSTATFTPIPNISPAWNEFSPGSAIHGGITQGFNNHIRLSIAVDLQGRPAIAMTQVGPDREDYTYAKIWDGSSWVHMGTGQTPGSAIPPAPSRLFRMFLDPTDNRFVVSMDFYRNLLLKFNGQSWQSWANGGIDDEALEFFTDITFLPDGTPVALYNTGIGSSHTFYRVRKYVGGVWQSFSPGSDTGFGIANDQAEGGFIRGLANANGEIYALWYKLWNGNYRVYMRKWNGTNWVDVGPDSSTGIGIVKQDGMISFNKSGFTLDRNGLPLIAYAINSKVYVQHFNGQEWTEYGSGSNSGDGLCEPGYSGSEPVIVLNSFQQPVVIWLSYGPVFRHPVPLYAKQFNGYYWEPAGIGAASDNGIALTEGYQGTYPLHDAASAPNGDIILAYTAAGTRDIHVKRYQAESPEEIPETPPPSPTPTPIPAWFVLDGFGGIHSTNPDVRPPLMPYFMDYNIVRDLEPDPLGRGWYMLDGHGGIHTSSPDLPKPSNLPYFDVDIVRNLEIKVGEDGLEFYLMDGLGTVHTSHAPFDYGSMTWFGFDVARDLEWNPQTQEWLILDSFGLLHSNSRKQVGLPQGVSWTAPLVRGISLFPNQSAVVLDAYAGRHTNPNHPAVDIIQGLPSGFYFPGFDIIWDCEVVPATAE